MILLLLLGEALPALLPVPRIEKPPGPYEVGTVTFDWTDLNREELLTPQPGDHRELNVQLWYPADRTSKDAHSPFIPGLPAISRYVSSRFHVPGIILDYFRLTKTHAYRDSPVSMKAGRQLPVVILSHGWPGYRFTYNYLAEGLASEGYVVAILDHTYHATITAFPDGRVATMKAGPPELNLPAWDSILNDLWSLDTRFVLDRLTQLNQDDPSGRFLHRLDLKRVAAAGHSFGGDNAYTVLQQDGRFQAAINLDGAYYGGGEQASNLPARPYLWLCTETSLQSLGLPKATDEELSREGITHTQYEGWLQQFEERRRQAERQGGHTVAVKDAHHSNFSDYYLFSPILRWVARAPDPVRIHRTVLRYTTLFLDDALNGKSMDSFLHAVKTDPKVRSISP